MAGTDVAGTTKSWELSLYELHRTPQEPLTGDTTIAVSPRSLHSELMCPICLDMLKNTMTTKECLHRFCNECIITALRSGNKECPTCRKKLVSKRSLRPDPNFDSLIAKIYPSRDEYEAHQERVLAKLNKSHSQAALVTSIEEGIKLQAQQRQNRKRAAADDSAANGTPSAAAVPVANGISGSAAPSAGNGVSGSAAPTAGNGVSGSTTSSAGSVVSGSAAPTSGNGVSGSATPTSGNVETSSGTASAASTLPAAMSSSESGTTSGSNTTVAPTATAKKPSRQPTSETESSNMEVDREMQSGSLTAPSGVDEVELVFRPHPLQMGDEAGLWRELKDNAVRYLKTTANATVDHLIKYLSLRLPLELDSPLPALHPATFRIHVLSPPGTAAPPAVYMELAGDMSLRLVHDKYWKHSRPLELFYSWPK